jgi:hypothetical protein
MSEVLQQMLSKDNEIAQIGYLIHPLHQDVPLPVLRYADDTLHVLHSLMKQAAFAKLLLDSSRFSGCWYTCIFFFFFEWLLMHLCPPSSSCSDSQHLSDLKLLHG